MLHYAIKKMFKKEVHFHFSSYHKAKNIINLLTYTFFVGDFKQNL